MSEHNPPDITQYRLEMIEKTLASISESLHQLTALEQKHLETREALGRAFDRIEDHDQRVRKIETQMPTLNLVKGWVITTVIGVASLVGLALFKLLVK